MPAPCVASSPLFLSRQRFNPSALAAWSAHADTYVENQRAQSPWAGAGGSDAVADPGRAAGSSGVPGSTRGVVEVDAVERVESSLVPAGLRSRRGDRRGTRSPTRTSASRWRAPTVPRAPRTCAKSPCATGPARERHERLAAGPCPAGARAQLQRRIRWIVATTTADNTTESIVAIAAGSGDACKVPVAPLTGEQAACTDGCC